MSKRHIRNNLISFFSFIGFSCIHRIIKNRKSPLVRVVTFHDIQDTEWFQNTLECLSKNFNVISPEDFFVSKFDRKKINVLITFDDGYTAWVNTCLPVLNEYNMKAVFFINSGLIDAYETEAQDIYVRERLLLSPRKTLSWDGVRVLRNAGHTIGGHTTTHARLSELQEEMQHEEIASDKRRIEEKIGSPVTSFAYPFGQKTDYTDETKHIVKEGGYTHAFTTESSFVRMNDSFTIPRLCLEETLTQPQLKQWVSGGYDIYQAIKRICAR